MLQNLTKSEKDRKENIMETSLKTSLVFLEELKEETSEIANKLREMKKASPERVNLAVELNHNRELIQMFYNYIIDMKENNGKQKKTSFEMLNTFKKYIHKNCEKTGKTIIPCSPLMFVLIETLSWIGSKDNKYSFEFDTEQLVVTVYVNWGNFENREIRIINKDCCINVPLNRETLDKHDEWLSSFDDLEELLSIRY